MGYEVLERVDLEIFWSENRDYILLYCAYALVVLGATSYFERRLQLSDEASGTLTTAYVAIWALSVALFALGMFVTGWLGELFGGEMGAFVVMVLVSFVLLAFAMRWSIHHFEVRLGSPNWFCGLSAAALLIPYAGFHIFVFILASADWRH